MQSLNDGAAMFLAPASSTPIQKFVMVNLGGGGPLPTINLSDFQDYQIISRAFQTWVVAAAWYNNGANVATKTPSPSCYDRWRFAVYDSYSDYGPRTGTMNGVFALFSLRPGFFDYCRSGTAAEIGYSYMGSPNMPIAM